MSKINLLTRQQVAELLFVSVRTIDRFKCSGDLPYIQVGKQLRFRLEDVERFLELHTHGKEVS